MELNEKLQELRKQKGLTQEELAQALYVSRTAISKWESGRGYPNIDSLKAIAKFFCVSIDDLLSGEELLTLAEEDHKQKQNHLYDLLFGLLDLSVLLLLFLPLFGQRANGGVEAVSLIGLTAVSPYLQFAYFDFISSSAVLGILALALQNCARSFWVQSKTKISLILNVIGVLLFTVSMQVYAAVFLFVLLIIKASILLKNR
jgi:transcriptional regulator with XRE-family HTH domain